MHGTPGPAICDLRVCVNLDRLIPSTVAANSILLTYTDKLEPLKDKFS